MKDPQNTMEDTKDDKKEKESPELKEELTEEELKGLSGGAGVVTGSVPGPSLDDKPRPRAITDPYGVGGVEPV